MLACSRVFLAFACFSFVSALGVSHQALISMDYEPGFNESYGYAAINSADNDEVAFARYVCGPLSPYVGLNLEVGEIVFVERDCNAIASGVTSVANPHILPGGGIKYFTYTVALPQTIPTELKPGINQAFLGFMQVIAGTGGVGGRVAVQIPITVYVPYPGKYLEVFLSADSAKRGEPVEFKMRAENKGTENVSATAIIRISDSTGKELKKLEAGSAQVATKNSATLSASLDTSDMEIASYTAKAVVEYGGSAPATSEAKFKIGELSIRINNVGIENAYAGKTAKAYVEVESMWGDPISGVYAEINVTKGAYSALLEKTFPQTVGAWEKLTLPPALWEVGEAGEYDIKATVYYEGKTAEKTVAVTVAGASAATATPEATETPSATAAPQPGGTDVMPIILGIFAICVIGCLLYWLLRRKKEEFAISLTLSGTKLTVSIGNTTDKEGKTKGFVEILNQHGSVVATVPLPEATAPAFGTKTVSASLDSVPLETGTYTLKVTLGINGKKHEATQSLAVS